MSEEPITTWRQRCERFNDGHITTTNDIQMVMQEEIDELRVEVERLKAVINSYEDERLSRLGGIGSPQ